MRESVELALRVVLPSTAEQSRVDRRKVFFMFIFIVNCLPTLNNTLIVLILLLGKTLIVRGFLEPYHTKIMKKEYLWVAVGIFVIGLISLQLPKTNGAANESTARLPAIHFKVGQSWTYEWAYNTNGPWHHNWSTNVETATRTKFIRMKQLD